MKNVCKIIRAIGKSININTVNNILRGSVVNVQLKL